MSKKLIALLLASMMLLSLVAACGNDTPSETPTEPTTPAPTTPAPTTPTTPAPTEPAKDEKYGGDLVLATTQVSTTIDPHLVNGHMGNYQWMQTIFETPMARGDDGQIYPLICDYTESEDGLTITLTVREYYFHNGEKVTIEDVLASLERAAAMDGSFKVKHWDNVIDKKIEGDTLTLTLAGLDVTMCWELAGSLGPCYVMPKEICEKYADGALIEDRADLIGTGPYLLDVYEPDVKVSVKRNDAYVPTMNEVGGPAAPRMGYADTITFAVNKDDASRTAAMIAGDYSVATILASMGAYVEQLGLKKDLLANQWTHAMFFNLSEANADSPVQDVNFRKAVRACLDMEAIALSIFQGERRFEVQASPVVQSNTAYYNDILETTEWNIADKELAKQYLAQSSYNGEEIVWLCGASTSQFYRAAMVAAPMMEEIGIKVKLWTVDSGSHGALRDDPTSGHDIGGWETQKSVFNPTTQNSLIVGTTSGWWDSAERDGYLDIMNSTPNGSAASVQAYKDLCALIADEVPWIGFCTGLVATYTQPDVVLNYQGIEAYYWNTYFEK